MTEKQLRAYEKLLEIDRKLTMIGHISAVLEYDSGKRIGERGVLYPVEHHAPHRHLPGVGLAPGLGGNEPGQKHNVAGIGVGVGVLYPQSRQRGAAHHPIGVKAVALLEIYHGAFRPAAENAVNRAGVVAPVFELLLDL